MSKKVFVPPIKCQGIKTKLVPWILENVEFNEQGRWIEPFMGSGVVGFNFRAKHAIFCDKNPHLVNFYNALKTGKNTTARARSFLEREGALLAKYGKDYYYEVRDRFNQHGDALDFLFLSRSCFNGVMRFNQKGLFNVPFGHKPQRFSKAYITKIINQIDYVIKAIQMYNWEFLCQDFRGTLADVNCKDFIYCDPPYAGRHVDYFSSWSDADERELHQLLMGSKAKFILSTWHGNEHRRNEQLDRYWKDCNILTRKHFYHVGANEQHRKPMVEAIVLNYTPKTAYCVLREV